MGVNDTRLWAFWKYDLPPYYLSGEVEALHEATGRVEVKNYNGRTFIPTKIVPIEEGMRIKKQIEQLGYDCSKTVNEARTHCRTEVEKLLGLNQ